MLHHFNEETWKRALEKDSKLKELAIKAGVENNYERAKEINDCCALDCGDGVINTAEEKELAKYMFCMHDEDSLNAAIAGRILMAGAAGISVHDL